MRSTASAIEMKKILAVLGVFLIFIFSMLMGLQSSANKHGSMSRIEYSPRLVILYATCSLNKDRIAPYNNRIRFTPNLKAFADESIVFQRHESESGFSGAAYACLFTGSYMYRHGVYYHPSPLASENYLIAEAFLNAHFDTFFWNSHSLAATDFNYAQGIPPGNVIDFSPGIGGLTKHDKRFLAVLNRLASEQDYKAFIQVNFTMTHAPYSKNSNIEKLKIFCSEFPEDCNNLGEKDLQRYTEIYSKNYIRLQTDFDHTVKSLQLNSEEIRKLIDVIRINYDCSVFLLDRRFGETLNEIRNAGLIDDSLIVFTSDHGEILYRPDSRTKWTHGNLEPEVLGIPLIIRMPNGSWGGEKYQSVTRSIDVFHTVAALSKIPISNKVEMDGTDLSSAILEKTPAPDLISFATTGLSHPVRGLNNDPSKMGVQVRKGDEVYRLYTLNDGTYLMTLFRLSNGSIITEKFDENNSTHAKMKKLLLSYKQRLIRGFKPPTDQSQWNDIRERLRSLGYLN
jgi:arylsulfatase A-like enzyme